MKIKEYLDEVIIKNFNLLVDKNFYSSIINKDNEIVCCTNLSAKAFGFSNSNELVEFKLSIKEYSNQEIAKCIFKGAYNRISADNIHRYVHKIYLLQKYVFSTGAVVSYIDMLPYNNKFKTYIVTLIPLYCAGKEIVALQTFSNETRIFHFQDYLAYSKKSINKVDEIHINENEFSERELEVLFLLSHGLTQEQCAQIQGISRSTVATMIKNLCAKFGVAGSNSKVLQQMAFQSGHHKIIPRSLWKPCVIITEPEAVSYINKELAEK